MPLLLLSLASAVPAADPPRKGPILPALPTAPVIPTPLPSPDTAVTIYAGEQFLVEDSVECVVACFPPSALKISHRFVPDKSTWTLTGTFIDKDGVVTGDREYVGPRWVYRAHVAEDCDQCWLVVLEVGGKKDSMEYRLLKCVKGPRPPPTPIPPGPGPGPTPVPPKPPEPVTSFHVVMVYESGQTLTAKQTGVLYSKDIRDYLDKATTPDGTTKGWRLRDRDAAVAAETEFQKALWEAVRPKLTAVPCWAIEVNGKVDIVPLPATVADGLALLKKYKGDK